MADLLEEFEIREGIVIPKEHYRFDRYNVKLDTSRYRQAELTAELEYGRFFTGTRFDILTSFEYRPSPHFARFVTPLGLPRRFDARFLVALAPSGQEPSHDKGEIVNWDWIRPQDALDRWAAGELEMMSPTVRLVAYLSRYRSAPQVMAVAKKRLDYKRVRVDDPEGQYRVVLPGEPGYETADLEVESGWVRLWEEDG